MLYLEPLNWWNIFILLSLKGDIFSHRMAYLCVIVSLVDNYLTGNHTIYSYLYISMLIQQFSEVYYFCECNVFRKYSIILYYTGIPVLLSLLTTLLHPRFFFVWFTILNLQGVMFNIFWLFYVNVAFGHVLKLCFLKFLIFWYFHLILTL